MGFIEKVLNVERCAACGRYRKHENLNVYVTRKLTDDGYVDFALNYCKDKNYCIKAVAKVPGTGW